MSPLKDSNGAGKRLAPLVIESVGKLMMAEICRQIEGRRYKEHCDGDTVRG